MPIYDVENRFSYYKSYSDNIMSGSALPTLGSSTWNRGVIGSVVSGSEEYKASTLLSDYTFKKANPFFRSGETRYLRLSSNSQTIKDSITPNIVDIYQTGSWGSGSLVYPSNDFSSLAGSGIRLLFSKDNSIVQAGSPSGVVPNIANKEWQWSYPYEVKYKNVRNYNFILSLPLTVKFREFVTIISMPPSPDQADLSYYNQPVAATNLDFVFYFISSNGIEIYTDQAGYYNGSSFYTSGLASSFLPTSLNSTLFQKLGFGINPKPLSKNRLVADTNVPFSPPTSYGPAEFTSIINLCTGSIIEGWRYGLYNGVPTNFSAVFRQNHYGQFRDMLEQRIYTATYNNPEIGGPMDANGGIKFISGSSLAGESNNYLTASIYNEKPDKLNVAEAYRVNPYGSGIFDTLYRASQPWHADDTRITVRARV